MERLWLRNFACLQRVLRLTRQCGMRRVCLCMLRHLLRLVVSLYGLSLPRIRALSRLSLRRLSLLQLQLGGGSHHLANRRGVQPNEGG